MQRFFHFSIHEQHSFLSLSFWAHFGRSWKVDITVDCWGDQNSSDFIQKISSILVYYFRLFLLHNCLNDLVDFESFISTIHLSKLVHALLELSFRLQITYFVCSWLFFCRRDWIGTRTLQFSNCSKFISSFNWILARFGSGPIPHGNSLLITSFICLSTFRDWYEVLWKVIFRPF